MGSGLSCPHLPPRAPGLCQGAPGRREGQCVQPTVRGHGRGPGPQQQEQGGGHPGEAAGVGAEQQGLQLRGAQQGAWGQGARLSGAGIQGSGRRPLPLLPAYRFRGAAGLGQGPGRARPPPDGPLPASGSRCPGIGRDSEEMGAQPGWAEAQAASPALFTALKTLPGPTSRSYTGPWSLSLR